MCVILEEYKTTLQFAEQSIATSGQTCPKCGSNLTYLNASSISMTRQRGHTKHKCTKCGEIYEIVYHPSEIKKLRKDF